MSCLFMKAPRLQKLLCDARKDIKSRFSKLATLMEVGEKITSIKKEATKLMSSVMKSQEYRLAEC